jgi:superfamily II DNA/RNA helicase
MCNGHKIGMICMDEFDRLLQKEKEKWLELVAREKRERAKQQIPGRKIR